MELFVAASLSAAAMVPASGGIAITVDITQCGDEAAASTGLVEMIYIEFQCIYTL